MPHACHRRARHRSAARHALTTVRAETIEKSNISGAFAANMRGADLSFS
jgi:hypothetical protein